MISANHKLSECSILQLSTLCVCSKSEVMLNTATTNKKMCSKQANIAQNDVYTVFLLSFTSQKKKNAHEKSKIMKQFIYRFILSFYDKRNIIHTSKNIRICHSDYFEIFILFNNFLRLFYFEVVFSCCPLAEQQMLQDPNFRDK